MPAAMVNRALIASAFCFTIAFVIGCANLTQGQDPSTTALFKLTEYGVLGVAVILLIMALIRKDRQVNALYIRLVEKAEKDADKYHQLAEALNDTMQELTDSVT